MKIKNRRRFKESLRLNFPRQRQEANLNCLVPVSVSDGTVIPPYFEVNGTRIKTENLLMEF